MARYSGCLGGGEEFPRGRRGIPVVWGAARNFQEGGGEVFRLYGGRRGISNRGAARYSGCLGGGEKFLSGGAASSSWKSSPPLTRVKFGFGPG